MTKKARTGLGWLSCISFTDYYILYIILLMMIIHRSNEKTKTKKNAYPGTSNGTVYLLCNTSNLMAL